MDSAAATVKDEALLVEAMGKDEPPVATASETRFEVAFIGAPGMGKSTILNALIGGNDDTFEVGCGLAGVTEDVRKVLAQKEGYSINLIDTMGWPDPDPLHAAEFYDKVIEDAVNRELHCLVWVVNNERSTHADVAKKYKIFMREFQQCACKMILLMNGKQNYQKYRKQIKTLNEKRAADHATMLKAAQLLLKECKLEQKIPLDNIIICTDADWLEDNIEAEMYDRLKHTKQKKNTMRTFELIKLKFNSDKSLSDSLLKDAEATLAEAKQNVKDKEAEVFWARTVAVGSGVGAVASGIGGVFTFGATVGLAVGAATAAGAAGTYLTSLTSAQYQLACAKEDIVAKEIAASVLKENLVQEVAELKCEFEEFSNLLGGEEEKKLEANKEKNKDTTKPE